MKRPAAVVVILLLALTACTGEGSKDKDGPSLPLPDKAPSARGPATGPAMEPTVLFTSADELEELAGKLDTAQVERRSGAFVSAKTVVGYSVDDISGYDRASGEQLWTAKLDMEGGTVCFASRPDRVVKTFTVAYGEGGLCSELATIRVSDGKVLNITERLSDRVEFEGESAGGSVDHLLTIKGKDYLIDRAGVVWKMVKTEPEPIARLKDRTYFDIYPSPKGDMLIGSRFGDSDRCRVDGYALPSFEHVWTQDTKALFPDVKEECIISAARGNSALLYQETSDRYYMTQVDPSTGEILGQDDAPKTSDGPSTGSTFDLASAALRLDQAVGLPGGDTIFVQGRGITRYSLESRKVAWDLDLSQFQLDSDEDYPTNTVLPQGVTADGYLIATVSNNTAVEIVAIEVKTGKLVGRWAVPKEFRNGFQVEPGMTLFEDGIVLNRNFERWEFTFKDYAELKAPKGERYDIGIFTFPKPGKVDVAAVPTAGPVDTAATAIGGLKTPEGAGDGRWPGAFNTGSRLIAYVGNSLNGFDTKSGKKKWSLEVDADPAAKVCAAGEPDKTVKTFTIAYQAGGKGAKCDTVLRVRASDGKVLDRIKVPAALKSVFGIEVHNKIVYVATGNAAINRIADGALAQHAKVARKPYFLERTPQDPDLVISMVPVKDGRDWVIEAYRMPSFEPVWSTRASTALSRVDRESPVSMWRGNGLWLSTSYGESSDPDAVKDSLVQLDPGTGRVVARTGAVKRDYLADDLSKFSLTSAASASYLTAGFDNGDVVLPQAAGVMRYSLLDKEIRWAVDIESIRDSMEREAANDYVSEEYDLIDDGKTVLVTLSNNVSVEVMTLKASDGKITGRWKIPAKARNGLQTGAEAIPFDGGVALVHNSASWDYAFRQSGRKVPTTQRYDIGLFALDRPTS